MIRGLHVLAIGILVLAAGCARQPVQPVDNWQAHEARAAALTHWQLSGKLAVRVPDDNGSARLGWRQRGDDFRIDLSGPFGQGRVIIDTTDTGVRLRQGGEPPLEATSASELVWQATGWQLPVEPLLYWVRGIPSPETDYRVLERTAEGLLGTLSQNDWTLHFSDYHATRLLPLPGRIVAERDDIRLILVIHRWTFPEAAPAERSDT
ncbi:lipoprotein insertase outer membrane protein LolB [Marinimicrobium sp. ARAG 43.8]|uniref:lipoprotein insertase outer membrane protein LolB n=1 Tax=Marinimicrobium sp. ARAG 43.8 TaxID=3418719 RepID=UPI003CEC4016